MQKETRHISTLHSWEDNPRGILEVDYNRLKWLVERLGQFKPVIITADGTVLGGNMRLRVYQDLGITDIWVSVVDAPTDAMKLEYAMADNDRAGYYEEDALAGLLHAHQADIDLTKYSIDLGKLTSSVDLLAQYSPDLDMGDGFSLPEGDKSPFEQITFTLANEQAEVVREALAEAMGLNLETWDNENKNGNAIYWICKQWLAQRTS